ncbi:MAG: hypothetical protein IKF60_10680 [Solobacterium sp.]|jgi:uncharacterized protein YpmB|nr:hypothetical protein [Solobacterium sp.]MBR3347552.1 hypothetical protein [Solobacterium sp.]
MSNIFIIIIVAVIVCSIIYTFLKNQKISKNGIEADAVVSRIETNENTDADGNVTTSEEYYVTYTNAEGKTVEAKLGNVPGFANVGTKMRIKYLPEKPKYVVKI